MLKYNFKKKIFCIFFGIITWISLSFVSNNVILADYSVKINGEDYVPNILYKEYPLDKTQIILDENGGFEVNKTFYVNYPDYVHGELLQLPSSYSSLLIFTRKIGIEINSVCYQNVQANTQEICDQYEFYEKKGKFILKIGNPDKQITGIYKYDIKYTVKNALISAEGYDELPWNIIEHYRDERILKTYFEISTVNKIQPVRYICYTGQVSSKQSNCEIEVKSNVIIGNVGTLYQNEGVTIGISYPKNSLKINDVNTFLKSPNVFNISDYFVFNILPNLVYLLPIIVFIFMFVIWFYFGKDDSIYGVIPEYRPMENIDPQIAGFVFEMETKPKHITSEIINLAINGYITIKNEGKDYVFIKKKEIDDRLPIHQKTILNGLFSKSNEVNSKTLGNRFFVTQELSNNQLKKLSSSLYFYGNPVARRSFFIGIAVTIGFLLYWLGALNNTPSFIATLISIFFIVIFGVSMGKRNAEGSKLYKHLLGLKMYINLAEKDRIKYHNDPSKLAQIKTFESLLPYAIIFGLETKWAREFETIYEVPPNWYSGNIRAFNTLNMVNSLNTMQNSIISSQSFNKSYGSHAGSGFSSFRGGSSGGGFGGGSRSSW